MKASAAYLQVLHMPVIGLLTWARCDGAILNIQHVTGKHVALKNKTKQNILADSQEFKTSWKNSTRESCFVWMIAHNSSVKHV